MFRQTKQHHHKTEEYYYSQNYLNQDDKYVRLPSLEGKTATHSMEENRPNINNRHYQDHVASSNAKSREKNTRGSAIRGIQVTSSRQSNSRERKGLATSRSHQKQKESREIKSQTNISQFESYIESKQSSVDQKSHRKQLHQLCLYYQHKIRESILKNNSNNQAQIDELTKAIEQNEDRIDNLIRSLNILLEKNQKKQQVIQRLEGRLKSITNYHQQCYEYTLARCQSIQSIFRVIADEIESQTFEKQAFEAKMKAVDLILKDIFMIQRIKSKHQMEFAEKELIKMRQVIGRMDQQLYSLQEMNERRQIFRQKEYELKDNIIQMKDVVHSQCRTATQSQISSQDIQFHSQSKIKQLQALLQSYKKRLDDLQCHKAQLTNLYLSKQQKAQESIWELSNLLNKHQRQLQKKQKEVEQYLKYNIEIENKLIESKLKENSLRVEMESICKGLENSKNDQCDLLIQEKECYKTKFQEIFKHNQYLEEVNAKNKLVMIRHEKELSALAEKLQSQEKKIYELQKAKGDIKIKEQYWSDRLKDQKKAYELQTLRLQQQNQQKQSIINQTSKQILRLQTELKEVLQLKSKVQSELSKLQTAYGQLKKELQQQQLYSEHLQNQNQELSTSLNQYKEIFQKQSQMFKSTIEKLKQENSQLQRNFVGEKQKISKNHSKPYENNRMTFNPNISKQEAFKQPSQKLINLQKQFLQLGLKLPVLCQIDCFGYLKSCESGTYIYDAQQNTIELTVEQRNAAVQMKILELFQ